MKKMTLFFTVLSIFSMNVLLSSSVYKERDLFLGDGIGADRRTTSQLKKFCSQYCASVILSGCIGAVTGGLVKCLEKNVNIEPSPMALFLLLLSWAMESEFRNEVIAVLQKDLDAYSIGHKKSLMFKAAWIASWMAYLNV